MLWLAGMSVHVFTALGSACALFATLAAFEGAYERAFIWLFVALAIDAIDGAFARAVDIETHVPRFSGERLDLVVDYLTYVFVPVLVLLHARLLAGWVGYATAVLILLSSLYHFADLASKASDNCFVGFPAVWNLVAFCFLAWGLPSWAATAAALVLVALAFVPMHWLHPMRVDRFFGWNVAMMSAGLVAAIWILSTGFPAGILPALILAASTLYFVVLALGWQSLGRGEPPSS